MGSVYGSTGPLERRAGGGPPLSADVPAATLKDNVAAQRALLQFYAAPVQQRLGL